MAHTFALDKIIGHDWDSLKIINKLINMMRNHQTKLHFNSWQTKQMKREIRSLTNRKHTAPYYSLAFHVNCSLYGNKHFTHKLFARKSFGASLFVLIRNPFFSSFLRSCVPRALTIAHAILCACFCIPSMALYIHD